MADLGMPEITIKFKGLGVSAVQRGEKGLAVLIVKDDTDSAFTFREYRSIEDLTSEEMVRFTEENAVYIKDVLEGAPRKLIVARMGAEAVLADLLRDIKGKIEMNCWMALANGSQEEQDDLASFVKSNVKNDKKRYKALVYKATSTDDAHIINYTNETVYCPSNSNFPFIIIKDKFSLIYSLIQVGRLYNSLKLLQRISYSTHIQT